MATIGGPNIGTDGLILYLDATNRKSTLKSTQSNNILPDPGNWTTGTGNQTGYSSNGSASEQNRVVVIDDPWNSTSITWRTTPDSVSGADGGWNSLYYSVDINYSYRYSMWVRRYTAGTGGIFYMGMSPNPLRNDNNNSQDNPYFTFPSISSLTQNQWYLVVGHVFYEGYSGGRHPESGWYENGIKISDKSVGNIGSQDVRWALGTTSARHRAYHYYTTNINSGIEFAYPRIDKIDGNEPTVSELIDIGESGWRDLIGNTPMASLNNSISYTFDDLKSSFNFDGIDDYIELGNSFTNQIFSINMWVKPGSTQVSFADIIDNNHTGSRSWVIQQSGSSTNYYYFYTMGQVIFFNLIANSWQNLLVTYNPTTNSKIVYVNGKQIVTGTAPTINYDGTEVLRLGKWGGGGRNWNGSISSVKIYNRVLIPEEVQQNYNSTKVRFGL